MKTVILYLIMSWLIIQCIHSSRQTALERTYILEAKRTNAMHQENIFQPTWNLGFFKNLVVSWIFVLCCEGLSYDVEKPSKFERHLQSEHPVLAKKPHMNARKYAITCRFFKKQSCWR